MRKSVFIFIAVFVSTSSLYAQNKTIKGRIISDDLEALAYLPILINDTVEIGKTDLNGFFSITIPVSVKELLFKYVGVEPASVALTDTCNEAEVVMMRSGTYDFMTPGKAEKLRKKKFKKLPALHKEAFAKGLFKTERACYTQSFKPY